MIVPLQQKHTIYQGATWERVYQVNTEAGTPENLTGCSARLVARKTPKDVDKLLDIIGTFAPLNGQVKFTVLPTDTIGQTWLRAGFDAELTWPDGHIDKIAVGTMTLVPEYTK